MRHENTRCMIKKPPAKKSSRKGTGGGSAVGRRAADKVLDSAPEKILHWLEVMLPNLKSFPAMFLHLKASFWLREKNGGWP